jgi:hypothetical protein
MSELLKTIGLYYSSKAKIFELFGTDGYYDIENKIGHPWYLGDGSMQYLMDDVEYGYEYAEQVGNTVDGLKLFAIQENGEKYYAIFNDEDKMTDEEADEKFGW